jgi:hypothetical protein
LFASAAAITLGAFSMPVYEIYKAGHDVHWLAGLDILSAAGLRVAVVPHFNNSEGGAHDSRYSYIGERRFLELESQLGDEAWVLGIDENTALTIDLEEQNAEVRGPGTVTVRAEGAARQLRAGSSFPMRELDPRAGGRSSTRRAGAAPSPAGAASAGRDGDASARRESAARAALDAGDVDAAVEAMLELEEDAVGPSRAPEEAARHALRSAILRIGELAAAGRTERTRSEMLVGALLGLRSRARDAGDWQVADEIRDVLAAAGVSIRDTATGSLWERSGPIGRDAGPGS